MKKQEKIEEYHAHFKFLFGDVGSNRMKISLHNLGDCKEILHGIILYYRKQLKDNMLPEELLGFDIDIYGKNSSHFCNAFVANNLCNFNICDQCQRRRNGGIYRRCRLDVIPNC